jgi:REP element-mobilizing transposase RayT
MSKVQNIMHVVINTKCRRMTITEKNKRQLYFYMWGIIGKMNCHLYWMNGIPNHIHLLVDIDSSICIAKFVQELKRASSVWLKSQKQLFPHFEGWGHEYCAFSKGYSDIDTVINYIRNQEKHHHIVTYEDEMTTLLAQVGMEWVAEYYD